MKINRTNSVLTTIVFRCVSAHSGRVARGVHHVRVRVHGVLFDLRGVRQRHAAAVGQPVQGPAEPGEQEEQEAEEQEEQGRGGHRSPVNAPSVSRRLLHAEPPPELSRRRPESRPRPRPPVPSRPTHHLPTPTRPRLTPPPT